MKQMKTIFLTISTIGLCIASTLSMADCSSQSILPDVPLYFYNHSIGTYTINLQPTLQAIEDGQDHGGYPYYEKPWSGRCPGGLDGSKGSCVEFTVYPDGTNFTPGDIMKKIEHYTHGKPNRGEVRIISDSTQTEYVYTTNHEQTFCGPYAVPG